MTKLKLNIPTYVQDWPRFSRKWWFSVARRLLLVVIITVLIWVYADMENVREKDVTATIHLTVAAGRGLTILADGEVGDRKVTFTLKGSQRSLKDFQRHLDETGAMIEYDVSAFGPGEHGVPCVDILKGLAEVKQGGLTVKSALPATIPIKLDRLISVPGLPVQFVYKGAKLAKQPQIKPPKVGITVAESAWKEKVLPKNPTPTLKTVMVDLEQTPTDKPITAEIIKFIEGVSVQPEQDSVTVTVEVSQLIDTREITVTVRVLTPPAWAEDDVWSKYEFVQKDPLEWRPAITVSGAKTDLAKLRPEGVHAYVVLTEADKRPVSWLDRAVSVHLPEGLNLKLVGKGPRVNFKLVKKGAAGGP